MIIIELKGGLGNQMFQYALFLKLVSLGKNVKFDVAIPQEQNLMLLERYFDISLPVASKKEVEEMKDSSLRFFTRVRRKILGSKGRVYVDKLSAAQKQIFEMDDIYLSGYWQSEKYFIDIRNDIKAVYNKMMIEISEHQKAVLDKIKKTESVSIHIRRGDYLKFSEIYGGICTDEYYQKAMEYFNNKDNITFFVFSNDYEYVSQHFKGEQFVIIEPAEDGATRDNDLLLMKECKHNIIANSSFSWWGAWLNENESKTVIAPSKWNNIHETKDIWCDDWIRI